LIVLILFPILTVDVQINNVTIPDIRLDADSILRIVQITCYSTRQSSFISISVDRTRKGSFVSISVGDQISRIVRVMHVFNSQ